MDSSLLNIQMNERESVQDYVKQFSMALNRGEGYDDAIAPIAFKWELLANSDLYWSLHTKKPSNIEDTFTKAYNLQSNILWYHWL